MKERRKFFLLQRSTDEAPHHLYPTAWVAYMSNLLHKASVWLCCSNPSTCGNARLQKKASAQEHEKDPTQLLFDMTTQLWKKNRPRNQTYSPPKLWQETSTLGCVSMEMEGLQLFSLALNGGPAGCRYVGYVVTEGFPLQNWAARARPMPVLLVPVQTACTLSATVRSLSESSTSSHGSSRRAKEAVHLWNVTKTMSRKQVNENSQTIAD